MYMYMTSIMNDVDSKLITLVIEKKFQKHVVTFLIAQNSFFFSGKQAESKMLNFIFL